MPPAVRRWLRLSTVRLLTISQNLDLRSNFDLELSRSPCTGFDAS